ncbi:hypothetical protein GQF03_06955 [Sneathiella chungangensis]|uniref:Uncharacterized protein n=1 Tax=Sneathiella chungangensis TaxID=1418234 RepID=A0A845MFP2_9PROT|nr:AIM24 family protein [Sneathiella chungangensis]MZR22067.1 hypothetical protein [Sneathiella chungangensis]
MFSRFNGVFQRLLWLIVLTGTVPAAVSTTLPPTHWCLNFSDISALFDLPAVGCFGGSSIAPDYLTPPFTWVYLVLFALGLLLCLLRKKVIFVIALVPLLLLYVNPPSELSVYPKDQITPDYFEPKSGQTAGSIEATLKEILPEYDVGAAEANEKYTNVRNALAVVKTNANSYWQSARRLDDLYRQLEDAREDVEKINQFVASTQTSIEKMKQLGGMAKKAVRKLEELLDHARDNKKKNEAKIAAIQKRIKALQKTRNARLAAFMTNLDLLNTKVSRSLASEPNENIRAWTLIISASSLLALAFFAFGHHLRSAEFAIACLILVIAAFNPLAKMASGVSFSQALFSLLFATYPLVLFFVTAIFLRLLALAIIQNIPLVRQFNRKMLTTYLTFTVLRWIPIGICIVIGLWLSSEIDSRAQDAVYGIECTEKGAGLFECDEPTTETLVQRGEESNLERDIYHAVDRAFLRQEQQLDVMLADFRRLAKTSKKQIPAFVDREFRAVYPEGRILVQEVPSLKAPDCKIHQVDCHVTRKIKIALVDAYDFTRNRQLDKLHAMTSDFARLSGAEAEKRLREIELYLSATLDATKRSVRNTIADVFWTVRSLNLLANLILIIAAIKSFAYIFARVAFKSETGNALPIEPLPAGRPSDTMPEPDIRSGFDPEYVIKPGEYGQFYIKPALSPSGSSQGIAWPQPHKAILRRLFSGTYKMVKVDPNLDRSDTISIQTSQGRQFLEWNLKDGERVYFSQGNLAAFSETIRLQTHISLSLTAMSFGRMFFSVAEGPGTLVLRTFGKPEVYRSAEKSRAIDPLRFIGWSDGAHFFINSSSSLENIYFHSAQIRFSHGGAAIGDVSENGKRGAGAVRFIPPVFLPF